jgi:hypothetical protein
MLFAPSHGLLARRRHVANRTAMVLGLAAFAAPAIPQSAAPAALPTYNIEVIVFRNNSGASGGEDWTARTPVRGGDAGAGAPTVGRFVASIPAAQYQLAELKARLAASSTLQPIAHFAWQQTPSSWGSRAGFQVQRLAGSSVPGLSGMIYLERGQFLHLGMTLNYSPANPPGGLGASSGTTFNISEIRRIKFFERNYYDHPAFGVIALVTPANRPTGGR